MALIFAILVGVSIPYKTSAQVFASANGCAKDLDDMVEKTAALQVATDSKHSEYAEAWMKDYDATLKAYNSCPAECSSLVSVLHNLVLSTQMLTDSKKNSIQSRKNEWTIIYYYKKSIIDCPAY